MSDFLFRCRIFFSGAAIAIRIVDGRARLERGQVRHDLLAALTEVAGSAGVRSGWILAVRRGQGHQLRFSKSFPASTHQPIRNLWAMLCR